VGPVVREASLAEAVVAAQACSLAVAVAAL
jgi:hypothetical protein